MDFKVYETNGVPNPTGGYSRRPSPIGEFETLHEAREVGENFATDRVLSLGPCDRGGGVVVIDEKTGQQYLIRGDEDEAHRRRDAKEKENTARINGILRVARENGRVELDIEYFTGSTSESGWLKYEAQTQQYYLRYDGRTEKLDEGQCFHCLERFSSVEIASS
jgi:hypothetical protein